MREESAVDGGRDEDGREVIVTWNEAKQVLAQDFVARQSLKGKQGTCLLGRVCT
jgi:hypothetical protein